MLRGHLARGNPQWRDISPDVEALAIFDGPDSYITPAFYETKRLTGKDVPTWNYTTVQVRGPLSCARSPDWLLAHLRALSTGRKRAGPSRGRSTTRQRATSRPRRERSSALRCPSPASRPSAS